MLILILITFLSYFCMNSNAAVLTIGEVQGKAKSNASQHRSPHENKRVSVQGVIHSHISWKERNGRKVYAIFLQNLPEESDRDPSTSDGLLVFLGKYENLYDGRSQIMPTPGLHVSLIGTIKEFYGSTQLTSPKVTKVEGEVENWQERLRTIDISPPSNSEASMTYWESIEGMRCKISKGAIVTGPSKSVGGGSENYVWVINSQHPVAKRESRLERRVFRDAHPLDDIQDKRFDNDNQYRILLSSIGLLAKKNEYINQASSLDTLISDIYGAADYSYGNYRIIVSENPRWQSHQIKLNPTLEKQSKNSWSAATYNIENLYDYRNDSSDPCDFKSDKGNQQIRPPFNYVPLSTKEYARKLNSIANDVYTKLNLPDLLLLQELEDQDIAFVSLSGKKHKRNDGQPDVLQDLQESIKSLSGVQYTSASNRSGADYRGITCGFMIREDKWEWGSGNDVVSLFEKMKSSLPYNAKIFIKNEGTKSSGNIVAVNGFYKNQNSDDMSPIFSRALQIAVVKSKLNRSKQSPRIYLLNNHFSSIPNQRIKRRTYQARLLAAVAKYLEKHDPDAGIIMGGDLNVFPEPDDGTPDQPSYQLRAMYDLNWYSANEELLKTHPSLAYTYIYQGQAQTLDHLFFSPSLKTKFKMTRVGHINADLPDHPKAYRSSDHDPVLVYFNY